MATEIQYLFSSSSSHKLRLLSQAESGYSTTTSSEDGYDVTKPPKRQINDIISKPMLTLGATSKSSSLDTDPLDFSSRSDRKRTTGSIYSDMSSFDMDDSVSNFENPLILHQNQPEPIKPRVVEVSSYHSNSNTDHRRRHWSCDEIGPLKDQMKPSVIGSDCSAFKPVKSFYRCHSYGQAPSVAPDLLNFVETAGSELSREEGSAPITVPMKAPTFSQTLYTTDTMLNTKQVSGNQCRSLRSKDKSLQISSPSFTSFNPISSSPYDVTKLRSAIENSSGSDLKRLLKAGIESKNPNMIKTLNDLIKSDVKKQDETIEEFLHCVRCHKEFNPNENGRCNMPHPQSMVYVVGQDEEGTDFICRCCKSGFRLFKMDFYEESTNSLLTGHCYSGQHTTDSNRVKYLNKGGIAKSCAENGCVEFYV